MSEVGDRAGQREHAVAGARREMQLAHGRMSALVSMRVPPKRSAWRWRAAVTRSYTAFRTAGRKRHTKIRNL
jgi:hypothetical protein